MLFERWARMCPWACAFATGHLVHMHAAPCLHSAVVWWLYLLAYGAFPISLSTDLYNLFAGIVAPSAQYWFYLLMTPLAAQMPDFFCRCVQR